MALMAGEKISHYQLVEKIGEGGMGQVRFPGPGDRDDVS
jgi:hypothetical protein